jgi:catechol 2,3-dioxygenase-like lactoylglutathione lyase family enzyme
MELQVEGQITFFYYNDLAAAERFYGEIMGFEKVIDVDFAKVFRMADGAHMGIVDSEGGYLKPNEDKPVMLTVVVKDIDEWYSYLTGKGVRVSEEPVKRAVPDMTTFLTWDPEGYVLEILQFNTKPYG